MGCGCNGSKRSAEPGSPSGGQWSVRMPEGPPQFYSDEADAAKAARLAWYSIGKNVPHDAISPA